jgi:uncharacterized protein
MKCRLLSLVIALVIPATILAADDSMESLRARFQERYPKIAKLKSEGVIGETSRGYVAFVEQEKADAAQLVKDENADRETLYNALAAKEGTTAEKVAERNAKRNFAKAGSGEYLQGPDGKWQKKGA